MIMKIERDQPPLPADRPRQDPREPAEVHHPRRDDRPEGRRSRVSIPLPQLDVPHFRYGEERLAAASARATAKSASRSAAAQDDGDGTGQAGERPGRPHPRSRSHARRTGRDPRRGTGAAAHRAQGAGEHRRGEGQVHQHPPDRARSRCGTSSARTCEALKRQIAVEHVRPGRPARHPDPRGQAVPLVERRRRSRRSTRSSST